MKEKVLRTIARWTPKKLKYFILIDSWAEYTTHYPKKQAPACSMIEIVEYFDNN